MRFVDEGNEGGADSKDPHNIPKNVQAILDAQKRRQAELAAGKPPQKHVSLAPPNMPVPPTFGNQPDMEEAEQLYQTKTKAANLRGSTAMSTVEEPVLPSSPAKQPTSAGEANKTRDSFPKGKLGPEWRRVDFPSNLVPYKNITEIYVRTFQVADLEAVYDSVETRNHSGYIDALDQCISVDIRDLTVPDFMYFQYWLRMASYTKSPYTITWTSRYGDDIEERLSMPNLKVQSLEMTREQYAEWEAQGVCFPTVRESEYIINATSESPDGEVDNPPDNWAMQNAQYLKLPDDAPKHNRMEQKISLLRSSKDVDLLVTIQEFAAAIDHGVIESIVTVNPKFEPKKAIEFLRDQAIRLRTLARGAAEQSEAIEQAAGMIRLVEAAQEFDDEAQLIEDTLAKGEKYTPRKEDIVLRNIGPVDMFPTANTKAPADKGQGSDTVHAPVQDAGDIRHTEQPAEVPGTAAESANGS